jgi:hypothetical protein
MRLGGGFLLLVAACASAGTTAANERSLDARLHHLRNGAKPEWSEFSRQAEGPSLVLRFQAQRNATEWSLRLRQQDVKQTWNVLLGGKQLGRLRADENDMVLYLSVPAGWLVDGENTLTIEQVGKTPDDIRVGEIALDDRAPGAVLSEAAVEVHVLDAAQDAGAPLSGAKSASLPCRITVLNSQGALMSVGAASSKAMAVRPGVIYTGTGHARFGLPAGEYTIYAGRGFEYSVASAPVTLKAGDNVRKRLAIRREVPTEGYVSCDTHVHTLTYSGHGDASVDEQVLALAGEGVELPVATEHNRQVDYHAAAVRQGVRQYFTPVVGNEVTTAVGHFNVFPVPTDGPVPNYKLKDWQALFESIDRAGAKAVILNHPRDLHSGYRPFGPKHHNAATGENLDGWTLRANAMEVINSGAQQTDVMRPFRDWFGLLNRGNLLTPVGASDSHDVARFFVGQARTYLRCRDDQPGEIDVPEAVASFQAGRVLVSCGLLTEITVADRYGPGDLVPASGEVKVAVRVLGPGWVTAEKVELYANGSKVREARIPDGNRPGVKWAGEWLLPRFGHDVHLVAIATGPGVRQLYWPVAKPYQPASPSVDRRVVGSTGAVWLDADGDGRRTSALEYARRLLSDAGPEAAKAVQALGPYDEAVAAQAAGLLQARDISVQDARLREAARKAGPHVERGFAAFVEAWRESQLARSQPR